MKFKNYIPIIGGLLLASCGAAPSSASNSLRPTRLLVSEMMTMIMDDSYSLSIEMEEYGELLFNVQLPLVSVTQELYGIEEISRYLVDLTNQENPTIYYQEEDTWTSSLENGFYVTNGLLSPLMFLDPQSIDDSWFVFNEGADQYEIDPQFISVMFENSPLSGVEDLQVFMTNNNEIIIEIGGQMYDDTSTKVWYTLRYFDIGNTQVRLPENVQSLSGIILDEILQNSTNHTYTFYLNPQDGFNDITLFGSRDNETFAFNRFGSFSDADSKFFVEYYYTVMDGKFLEISVLDSEYQSRDLSEGEYQQALDEFYPVDLSLLTSTRLGQQPQSIPFYPGVFGYPLTLNETESILNTPYKDDVTNMEVYVSLSNTHWSGYTISTYLRFELSGIVYIGSFSMTSFDQVSFVNPPNYYGEKLSLSTIIERLKITNSFGINQVIFESSSNTTTQDFSAYFDGDSALTQTVNSLGYFDYDYFIREGNEFVKYSYQYNSGDFISESISNEAYQQHVIDTQWIDFQALDFSEDIGLINDEGVYPLVEDRWDNYLSDSLLTTYTVEKGEIDIVSPYEDNPGFNVTLQATNILTEQPVTLTVYIQSVGLITFSAPDTDKEPVDENEFLPITFESFTTLYAEGIQTFTGYYVVYDDQGNLSGYFGYSIQENSVFYVDFLTGERILIRQTEEGFIKQSQTISEEETIEVIDEAEYLALLSSLSYVDFDVLFSLTLTEIESGIYSIDSKDFDALFNLQLTDDEEVLYSYVYFDKDSLQIQIEVFNNADNTYQSIGLYFDSINIPIDLNLV